MDVIRLKELLAAKLSISEISRQLGRVGFLPEETYFFQDNGRNMVSSGFFHFLPEEMEEWDL